MPETLYVLAASYHNVDDATGISGEQLAAEVRAAEEKAAAATGGARA